MTQDDIVKLAERYPGMTVYSPPSPERTEVTAETLRKLETPPRAIGGPGMARTNGERGRPTNLPTPQAEVHSREKVRAVCVLQAPALNLCWANTLRRRIAAAAAMVIPAIA